MANLVSINISSKKGLPKRPIQNGKLILDHGLEGDVHAEGGTRQVSLLAIEDIKKVGLSPGKFAENITIEGIDFDTLRLRTRLRIGKDAVVELSQIGKECHTRCAIYKKVGDCIMPKRGIFAIVVESGEITEGDSVEILD